MIDFNAEIQAMVNRAVEARIGTVTSRQEAMVRLHGEIVKRTQAAKMLNVSTKTISNMCADGRLQETDLGVSVRSIADWISAGSPRRKVEKFKRVLP